MHKLNAKQIQLLDMLIALNSWELEKKEELQTQSGRSLYFQLAKSLLEVESRSGVPMKQRVGTSCERAIRERIRSFQEADLLMIQTSEFDARTREIVPTDKFVQDLEIHLDQCGHLLERRFILLDKK